MSSTWSSWNEPASLPWSTGASLRTLPHTSVAVYLIAREIACRAFLISLSKSSWLHTSILISTGSHLLLDYHHTKAWLSRISGKVFLYCISKYSVIYHLNLIIIHLDNSTFSPEGSLGNHVGTHSHGNMVNPRWHFGTLTVFHLLVIITVSVLVDDVLNL